MSMSLQTRRQPKRSLSSTSLALATRRGKKMAQPPQEPLKPREPPLCFWTVLESTADETPASESASNQSLERQMPLLRLPAELRLMIWSCSVEPRVLILDDLLRQPRAYPLPSSTQLHKEARFETRDGYEPVGKGSYFYPSRDILVCGNEISKRKPDEALKSLAPKIRRLVFWDCADDDEIVSLPQGYWSRYLKMYGMGGFGKIDFDQTMFSNLHELWLVKKGHVHLAWHCRREESFQFRYWRDQDIVEIAPLKHPDGDMKTILDEGRCGDKPCRQPGEKLRPFKVTFMRGKYSKQAGNDAASIRWERIQSTPNIDGFVRETGKNKNLARWAMVERALTFSLHSWAEPDEAQEAIEVDHLDTQLLDDRSGFELQ